MATPSLINFISGDKAAQIVEKSTIVNSMENLAQQESQVNRNSGSLDRKINRSEKYQVEMEDPSSPANINETAPPTICDLDSVPLQKIEQVYRAKTEQAKAEIRQALSDNVKQAIEKFQTFNDEGKKQWEVDIITLTLRENYDLLHREVEQKSAASQEAFNNTEYYSGVLKAAIDSDDVEVRQIQCTKRYCVAKLHNEKADWSTPIENIRASKEMHTFVNLNASAGTEMPIFFSFGESITRISRGLLKRKSFF